MQATPNPMFAVITASPEGWALSLCIGTLIALLYLYKRQPERLRFFWLISGICLLATAPALSMANVAVWGEYPTIDKQGAMLFFQNGVHKTLYLSPMDAMSDPAVKLIGVHAGHHWISELFAIGLPAYGAVNAHALLNIILSVFCMWLLLYDKSNNKWLSLLLACTFGLSLHQFRDINVTTIEKSSLYWLPLFWWTLLNQKRMSWTPIVYLGAALINVYWAILLGLFFAAWLIAKPSKKGLIMIAICLACAALIGLIQMKLQENAPGLATPEAYLWQRAALDTLTLSDWNRIPIWITCPPIVWVLFLLGLRRDYSRETLTILGAAFFFALLAVGPLLTESMQNPIYMLFSKLPGMWRFAKPEIFFHISWMIILVISVKPWIGLRFKWMIALLLIGHHLAVVRQSTDYPGFSKYIAAELPKNWHKSIKTPAK